MRVELRKSTAIQYYLVLIAPNGEPVAHSETYYSKFNAKRAAKKNFPDAELVDTTKKPYNKYPSV